MDIINLQDIILYGINFIILFVLIRLLLYKPVTKFMRKRETKVSEQLDYAENAKREADQLKSKYEKLLAGAHSEAESIIATSHKRASEQYDKIIEAAQSDGREMISRAVGEIEAEKALARDKMRDEITDMAIMIASKVLEREISNEDNKKLADSFFEEVSHK